MEQPTIRFLGRWEERIVLLFPVFAVAVFGVFWYSLGLGTNFSKAFFALASIAYLIDVSHLMFTYLILGGTPELRTWWTSREALSGKGFLKNFRPRDRAITVAVILTIGFLTANFSSWSDGLRTLAATWILFDIIGPAQHTIAQAKGLSLCYNQALKRGIAMTPDELIVASRVEQRERVLFKLLFVADLIFAIPFIIEGYFFEKFEIITPFRMFSAALLFSVVVALYLNGRKYPHYARSNKVKYLLRTLMYPIKALNVPVGALAIRSSHGVEYFFFCRNMLQNSSASPARRRAVHWAFFILVSGTVLTAVFVFGLASPFQYKDTRQPDLYLAALMAFSFTHQFMHFYLDSIIFKMSDSFTRKQVNPLIMGKGEPPAKEESKPSSIRRSS